MTAKAEVRRPGAGLHAALCAAALVALSACSMADGPGTLLVDPGRYDAYHCDDLATRWKALVMREKELRELMQRASQGGGGAVIGSLAYRSDYDAVLTEEKIVQRVAVEKKCGLTTQFQSDQGIR